MHSNRLQILMQVLKSFTMLQLPLAKKKKKIEPKTGLISYYCNERFMNRYNATPLYEFDTVFYSWQTKQKSNPLATTSVIYKYIYERKTCTMGQTKIRSMSKNRETYTHSRRHSYTCNAR